MITEKIKQELGEILPVLPPEIWNIIEDYLISYYKKEHKKKHGIYLTKSFIELKESVNWIDRFLNISFKEDSAVKNIRFVIKYIKTKWIDHNKDTRSVIEFNKFYVYNTNWDIFIRNHVYDRVGCDGEYRAYDWYSDYLNASSEEIKELVSHRWIVSSNNTGPFKPGKRLNIQCHKLGWINFLDGVKNRGYYDSGCNY